MEELSSLKTELADAKKLQVQSDQKYRILTGRYNADTQVLKGQVDNASYSSVTLIPISYMTCAYS